jgi:serine/threonine protein phosphatase PrpC
MLTVSTRSHPGTVRSINEDAVIWDRELGLLAVADGMGGHNAGEVASRLALEALLVFLRKSAACDDFTWPFGVNPAMSFAGNRMMTAVKVANRRVFRAAEEQTEYLGMGTTLVAALTEEAHLVFSSVGDSRIYLQDGAELRQLSRDDSWVAMLSREQGLDEATLEKHPMRHVLTNVLGAQSELEAPIVEVDLAPGQTLVLCTDGLHGAVPDEVMLSILRSQADLEQAADALILTALERDGRDNITLLLARQAAS